LIASHQEEQEALFTETEDAKFEVPEKVYRNF
jgi:hypothetical protein